MLGHQRYYKCLAQPAPASSMSWYLEFVQTPQLSAGEWLGFEAITDHCKDGYGLEDGCIWSQSGELLALTRQTVARSIEFGVTS